MADTKRYVVVALVAMCQPVFASSLGADFIDAKLYKLLEKTTKGPRTFNDWFSDNFMKRISVTGSESFGLHLDKTTGDTTAYDETTAYGEGGQTFTNLGQMSISGNKVAGLFSFNTTFADNRYQDPASHRYSLDYAKHGLSIDAGNIDASLVGGNQFLSFNRQLLGVDFRYVKGPWIIAGLATEQTSSATTVSFNGNNSPGPYYLQASELDPDSVRVEVDGKELNYPNDFTVNAVIGSITFNTLSVAPTSTIVVSYESTGVNDGGGTISGLGGSYTFGKLGTLGAMAIRETDPTANAFATFTDRFQGYGDPSVPYILQYTPLATRPIIVALDGVTQVANVDYQFSTTNPTVFYFLRYIATTSTVTVTYTPSPTTNLSGDRQVEGFNYTLPFGRAGRGGSINYSEAFSHLSNPVQPMSGTARALSGSYKFKNFDFSASVDDVPNDFVGIDSTGFLRNERSATATANYKVGKLTFSATGTNSAISSQSTDANGNLEFLPSRTTNLDGGAKYHGNNGLTWSFDQQHLTSWTIDGEAAADVSTFSLSKMIGKLNSHFDLSHTQGYGPISNGVSSTNGPVRLDSVGWRGDYAASHGWNFGGNTTVSAIDTNGAHGTGTDMEMSLGYRAPANKFGFDTSYTYSNSGQIATLGEFQDGTGLGYNGNAFSAGAATTSTSAAGAGTTGFNANGTDIRSLATSTNYSIAKRASIGANFFSTSDYGAIGTDSDTVGAGLSLDYDMKNGQRINFGLNESNTVFADQQGNATSLSFNIAAGGRPKGPWSYHIGVSTLISSGGTVAQNSFTYDLSLKHYLRANQAVGFDIATTNLTNYEPQDDFLIDVSYEYRLFKNVSVLGKYQIHNVTNLDPSVTTGAYSSRGFDVEMNFNFGS